MTLSSLLHPPRGWKAIPWRLPIWFYRLGLGWMLGKRFMLLTHTGRKSGLPRQAVIEIIRHDPETNTYYAASGFGERSDWFRNILKTPHVTIQIGNHKMSALAERLPLEEAQRELADYARRHPGALKTLARLIGVPYDGSEKGQRELSRLIPIVAFHVHRE